MTDWAALVHAADPSLVLPPGERRARHQRPGPLRLQALLPLGDRHGVGVVVDAGGGRWAVPLVLDNGLRRAGAGDGTAERLLDWLASAGRVPGFEARSWRSERVRGERAVTGDQTNESIVVGEHAVVKWQVRLPSDGESGGPAAVRITTLMDQGFTSMPRAWGIVEAGTALVATVVDYLPGALDGWDWAVEDARRFAHGDLDEAGAARPAARIGAITAELHEALASTGRAWASPVQLRSWRDAARQELAEAERLVGGPEGARLVSWAPTIAAAYDAFLLLDGTVLTDTHGDLHVGQILRRDAEYLVTDFDGNPVAPPDERGVKAPPATDVAGMLASLDHVARIVLHRCPELDPAVVQGWIGLTQEAFVVAYRTRLEELDAADLFDERLLRPLRLRQEVREYLYAVAHLPHWVYAPDLALAALLDA